MKCSVLRTKAGRNHAVLRLAPWAASRLELPDPRSTFRCLRQAGGFLVHRLEIRALQALIRARFLAHLVEQLNYITVLLLGFCLIPGCAERGAQHIMRSAAQRPPAAV